MLGSCPRRSNAPRIGEWAQQAQDSLLTTPTKTCDSQDDTDNLPCPESAKKKQKYIKLVCFQLKFAVFLVRGKLDACFRDGFAERLQRLVAREKSAMAIRAHRPPSDTGKTPSGHHSKTGLNFSMEIPLLLLCILRSSLKSSCTRCVCNHFVRCDQL